LVSLPQATSLKSHRTGDRLCPVPFSRISRLNVTDTPLHWTDRFASTLTADAPSCSRKRPKTNFFDRLTAIHAGRGNCSFPPRFGEKPLLLLFAAQFTTNQDSPHFNVAVMICHRPVACVSTRWNARLRHVNVMRYTSSHDNLRLQREQLVSVRLF